MKSCPNGAAGVRPLLSSGRRVVVDGHAICEACGGAVKLVAPDQWGHGIGRPRPPVSLAKLRSAPTYAAFRATFPWMAAIGEEEWLKGERLVERYGAALTAAGRRRTLHRQDNPYLALFELLTAPDSGPAQLIDLGERRRELASLFSWAIPTDAALDALGRYGPLVECGAGMGYWTALLKARGVDAIAYDLRPPGSKKRNAYHRRARRPWTAIRRGSSVTAARRHRDRTLVLCWPPFDDDAASYAALRAYRGQTVIHVGEGEDGATGSVRFHRELRLNWTRVEEIELPHWPRLRDRVMVYRRNAQRLAHRERDRCFECKRFIATGAIGRCNECFTLRPPALALRAGKHRVEYPQPVVEAMPAALRRALESSPSRIRTGHSQSSIPRGR